MLLSQAVPQFLTWLLNEKGYKDTTFRNYEHHMRYFLEWFGVDKNVDDITVETVTDYREFLNSWKSLTTGDFIYKSTREEKIKVVKRFLQFCNIKGIKALHPSRIETFKDSRIRKINMTEYELQTMLASPNVKTLEGLRDRALFEFLYSTGCRVAEVAAIEQRQVNWKDKEIVIMGKGDKVGTVYLSDTAIYWLKRYLEERKDTEQALFTHSRKCNARSTGFMGTRSIWGAVKKHVTLNSLDPRIGVHTFRHTFATDLLNRGATLMQVKELLRHNDIKSTQIYLHVAQRDIKDIHGKIMNKKVISTEDLTVKMRGV